MRLGTRLLFQHHAPINNYVFIGHVELGDAAIDLCAYKLLEFRGIARSAAACGHKRAHADIHVQAAFHDTGHCAHHRQFLRESFFQRSPVAGLRDFKSRQLVVAFLVAPGH